MTSPKDDDRGPFRTIRDDIRQGGFRDDLRRDYRELKQYLLTPSQQERLQSMSRFQRFFVIPWWLLVVLFRRLTVVRRILFIIALVLLGTARSNGSVDEGHFWGTFVILLFILLLEFKDKLVAYEELEGGRAVQEALLPPREPAVPGWQVWLFTRSANEVGGDLLDFISLGNGQFVAAIGDVSGKGLKAALVTARLQTTLRAFVDDQDTLAALAQRLNRIFRRDGLPASFASLTIFEFRQDSGDVRIVNAGHLPALVVRPGGIEERTKGGPAIGLTADAQYAEESIPLGNDDVLFAYSDGLTEARNEAGEFYGEPRLRNALIRWGSLAPRIIGTRLLEEVDRFAGEARRHDDLTILMLRRTG